MTTSNSFIYDSSKQSELKTSYVNSQYIPTKSDCFVSTGDAMHQKSSSGAISVKKVRKEGHPRPGSFSDFSSHKS